MDVRWTWCRLDALGVRGLYEVLALRCRVFVVGQGAYQDPDGLDEWAWHLVGRSAEAVPAKGDNPLIPATPAVVAYLRAIDPGRRYSEPSIGRVLTAPEVRGRGLGHALMAEGLARCVHTWPDRPLRISAQAHLTGYYRRWGFDPEGDPYLEDGIPHVEMVCVDPRGAAASGSAMAPVLAPAEGDFSP